MRYFLIEFDGRSVPAHVTPFDDADAALAALSVAERDAPSGMEVVLLHADSEDVLRRTHSRYFESWQDMLSRTSAELSAANLRASAQLPEPAATP